MVDLVTKRSSVVESACQILINVICIIVIVSTVSAQPLAARDFARNELRRLLPGRTILLNLPNDVALRIRFFASGNVSGWNQDNSGPEHTISDNGRWWLQNDQLCLKWKRWSAGRWKCRRVALDREVIWFLSTEGSVLAKAKFIGSIESTANGDATAGHAQIRAPRPRLLWASFESRSTTNTKASQSIVQVPPLPILLVKHRAANQLDGVSLTKLIESELSTPTRKEDTGLGPRLAGWLGYLGGQDKKTLPNSSLPNGSPKKSTGHVIVQSGDTLSAIARRHKVTIGALRRANGLRRSFLRVGSKIRLPINALAR